MAAQVQEGLEELSHILLLVYRNARDFYVLVLYTATLPNPLMSPNSFPVASLEFSRYSIMSTANSDSFTSLLIWILFFFLFLLITMAAAAAAKSLQSCPTLCDPIDGSPPGSPIPGILQARTLEWIAISFSNA